MPELPEVETTRRGIAPHIEGKRITNVIVREHRLRWPIPKDLAQRLDGRRIRRVLRRAKYLLLQLDDNNHVIVHLGMSGSLRFLPSNSTPDKHDHLDIVFGMHCLRLRDPRRFGAVLWWNKAPQQHPRLASLGPEPLSDEFDTAHLYRIAQGRRIAVKQLLMDGKVVVGVGNIYANEALFEAGIRPTRPASSISRARYQRLVEEVKTVLANAIKQGGTTLRDFQNQDGRPGYFQIQLRVYGRGGESCVRCDNPLKEIRLGQRSTVFCPKCQR